MQFLSEAIVMSLDGAPSPVLGMLARHPNCTNPAMAPTAVPSPSILIAFVFSACVGIFFGYYHGMESCQPRPIEALRYE